MRKIWDKLVEWLSAIPSDKKQHFVAGTIIAAFFALALGMKAAVVPAIAAGIIKEFFDKWTTDTWEWGDLVATILGGLLIQAFILLGVWWGTFPIQ